MNTQFFLAPQVRLPSPLELIRTRRERELLTDAAGAFVRQRMIWPRVWRDAGCATPESIAILRELVGAGDVAEIAGPLEVYVVLRDAPALTVLEALHEGGAR